MPMHDFSPYTSRSYPSFLSHNKKATFSFLSKKYPLALCLLSGARHAFPPSRGVKKLFRKQESSKKPPFFAEAFARGVGLRPSDRIGIFSHDGEAYFALAHTQGK